MDKSQKDTLMVEERPLSRHEKEIGIQISQMEQYRSKERCELGKQAYAEWAEKFGADIRNWLEHMSDAEIDGYFENLSQSIKQTICRKCR